jgi:hypothetical protein
MSILPVTTYSANSTAHTDLDQTNQDALQKLVSEALLPRAIIYGKHLIGAIAEISTLNLEANESALVLSPLPISVIVNACFPTAQVGKVKDYALAIFEETGFLIRVCLFQSPDSEAH